MRGNDTLVRHGVVCVVPQFPRPGVLPKLPLKPYEHTLGDIVLGTPQIKEDCESDGVELDSYLPVSQFPSLLVYLFHEILHLTGRWASLHLQNIAQRLSKIFFFIQCDDYRYNYCKTLVHFLSMNLFSSGVGGGGIVVGMSDFRFHCFLGQHSYFLSLRPGVLECTDEVVIPKVNPGVVLTSQQWEKMQSSQFLHATKTRMSSSHVSASS